MATDEAASEITRPRRRGEPRPEPQPAPAPEPAAVADELAEEHEPADDQDLALAEVEQQLQQRAPQAQPQPEPPAAPPVPAALPVADAPLACSFCFAQVPRSQLDDLGPLMRRCKGATACAARAEASMMYPMSEHELEQDIASFENRSGALR